MLIGVNLASGGFGNTVPGVYNADYTYPTQAEYQYYAGKGMKIVRLAFLIERVITSITNISFRTVPLAGVSPTMTDIQAIDQQIAWGQQYGLIVLLDPVGFGSMFGQEISTASTYAAFASFWGLMAARYASNTNVWFGLMNEPHQQTAAQWFAAVNPAIAAIRAAKATQTITIPGTGWTNALNWAANGNETVFTPTSIVDPANNYVIEVHQYLDSDGSGTTCTIATSGPTDLASVTTWARTNGFKLFLGELGVCTDATSLAALQATMTFMTQNTDVWSGYTYFAGGPWWGTYYYTIEPTGLGTAAVVDQPQMAVLTQFTPPPPTTGTVTITAADGLVSTITFQAPTTAGIHTLTIVAAASDKSTITAGTPVLAGYTFTPVGGQPTGQFQWTFTQTTQSASDIIPPVV